MRRITKFSLLLSLVLGLYFPAVFAQSNMTNEMFDLAKLKSGVKNKRISSTDPTGGNRDHLEPFKPGEKRIIADIKGAGAINHIWVTIAPPPPALSRNDIIMYVLGWQRLSLCRVSYRTFLWARMGRKI